jgi:hypothetical protein
VLRCAGGAGQDLLGDVLVGFGATGTDHRPGTDGIVEPDRILPEELLHGG